MIRGIIFDFDGLILETEAPAFHCVQEVFQEHGVVLPMERWAHIIGGSGGTSAGNTGGTNDVYAYLELRLGRPVDRETLRARVRRQHQRVVEQLPVLPGVESYIREAKAMGLKLAVASSSSLQWVAGHLGRLGLLAAFDVVKTRDDVVRTKPEPDLFVAALAGLGLQPREAIALEDSPNGVTAAKRAGLFCVAVPNVMTDSLPLDHADLRLGSLAEVPLRELLVRAAEFAPSATVSDTP